MRPKKEPMAQDPEDPQKGLWGGQSERNGCKLTATVKHEEGQWYSVRLEVSPSSPEKKLDGVVLFHLHDTFTPQDRVVAVKDGKAVLDVYAWGAFTVGAEAENGKTRLELDLSDLPKAPEKFREL